MERTMEKFKLGKIMHHQTLMLEIWHYLDLKTRQENLYRANKASRQFFKKYYKLITFNFGYPFLSIDRLSKVIEPVYADRHFIKQALKFSSGENIYIETLSRGE